MKARLILLSLFVLLARAAAQPATAASPAPLSAYAAVGASLVQDNQLTQLGWTEAQVEGWRLVEDPDGARGWVVSRLLSPDRGAIVIGKGLAPMREAAAESAPALWSAEPGVVGRLGDCADGWCRFDVNGREGWVRAERLWGAGEP